MAEYQEITELPNHPLEKGFYYHYKHDPNGSINNYAYEVMGVGRHTETRELSFVYRPLYENTYLDADLSIRPLEMSLGTVMLNGRHVPRFTRIENPDLITRLTEIRDQKYSVNT